MKIAGIEVPGATATIRANLTASAAGNNATVMAAPVVDEVILPAGWTLTPPGSEPQPTPTPGEEIIFSDDLTTITNLNGFNTTQKTGSGNFQIMNGGVEAWASEGEKAEIGHQYPNPVEVGDTWTVEGEFILLQGGNETFLCDVESTRDAGGGDSEPGPRLRKKNGGLGIEQQKFSGVNISPVTPPLTTGTRYRFKWTSLYALSGGWHKLWVAAGTAPLALWIDTDKSGVTRQDRARTALGPLPLAHYNPGDWCRLRPCALVQYEDVSDPRVAMAGDPSPSLADTIVLSLHSNADLIARPVYRSRRHQRQIAGARSS